MPVKKRIMNQELRIKKEKVSKPVIASKSKQSQDSGQVRITDKKIKTTKVASTLQIDVFDIKGGKTSMMLSVEVFGAKINKPLMAQAVRVFLANQRTGTASSKTRGEVQGSTRKIYQQKGTGRARHGGIRAPLFVGGGVAHGPRAHDFSLSMPKKMKKKALFSALTSKKREGAIVVVKGLGAIVSKTKEMVVVLKTLKMEEKKRSIMLVLPKGSEKIIGIIRATRNIQGVSLMPVANLNTYEVLKSRTVLFMQEAINEINDIGLKSKE